MTGLELLLRPEKIHVKGSFESFCIFRVRKICFQYWSTNKFYFWITLTQSIQVDVPFFLYRHAWNIRHICSWLPLWVCPHHYRGTASSQPSLTSSLQACSPASCMKRQPWMNFGSWPLNWLWFIKTQYTHLLCRDILSLHLLNWGLHFQLPVEVPLHEVEGGRVWQCSAELPSLPPDARQPGQVVVVLGGIGQEITALSLRDAILLFVSS